MTNSLMPKANIWEECERKREGRTMEAGVERAGPGTYIKMTFSPRGIYRPTEKREEGLIGETKEIRQNLGDMC